MQIENFLQYASKKVGARGAFELMRDARLNALEKIVLDKLGMKKDELDSAHHEELDLFVKEMSGMPDQDMS